MSQSTETADRSTVSTPDAAEPNALIIELDRDECLRLLETANVGRVAVGLADSPQPVIRPVNYVFDQPSQSVVIRSRSGSKLYALLHAKQAAFEIDGTEGVGGPSWSVIVHGVVEEISAPYELQRVERLGLESPAADCDSRWLSIRVGTVSGRAVAPAAQR